jgi:hypothetical protein
MSGTCGITLENIPLQLPKTLSILGHSLLIHPGDDVSFPIFLNSAARFGLGFK